jgi:hypothetical protein
MVLVHGGNTAIRVPLHTSSGDPVQRLSLGGVGLLDLRGPGSTYAAPTAMTAPVTAATAGSGLGIADVDELDVMGVKPPAARSATAIPACSRPMAA